MLSLEHRFLNGPSLSCLGLKVARFRKEDISETDKYRGIK